MARNCGPLAPQARGKCESEQYYAARQAQHNDRDLEAQRTTAIWTRYLGIAGILGTAFGTIGVILVLLTFMEQRRTSRAELRAYIDVSKALLMEVDGKHLLQIALTNFGQTPATNVSVWMDAHLMTWPVTKAAEATTLMISKATQPPHHPRRYGVPLPATEYEQMLQNTASFVIPMRVTYDVLNGYESDEFRCCLVVTCDDVKMGEARVFNHYDTVAREAPAT